MVASRRDTADRRKFVVGAVSLVSLSGLASIPRQGAAQSTSAYQRLQKLEEDARRVGIPPPTGPRVAPLDPQDQEAYSELMLRLVDLIDRSSGVGRSGADVADAAAELLALVHRKERGDPPDDELTKRAPPDFDASRDAYRQLFQTCTIRPERAEKVDAHVALLTKYRSRYEKVADTLGIPWHFIGIIHALEASFNFNGHLHNGDYPLARRTVHVPANRPPAWNPPTDWESSADDALRMKGFDKQQDWGLERTLYRWEGYNGFGYHWRDAKSPYLWSFSNHYVKGKYVRDGQWDPDYVSQQCGAAVMLKALISAGVVSLQ
jgi:lysozyme family protein